MRKKKEESEEDYATKRQFGRDFKIGGLGAWKFR